MVVGRGQKVQLGEDAGDVGLAFIGFALFGAAGIHTDRGTIAALGVLFGAKLALGLAVAFGVKDGAPAT